MLRCIKLLVAVMLGISSLTFAGPAQATTCGAYQLEWRRTYLQATDNSVYTVLRFRICTGNLGNQFADLDHMDVGYDWLSDDTPCSGFANLEKVVFDPYFWDSNDSWNPAPFHMPCQSDGRNNAVYFLSEAPDFRMDQLARWKNDIHVHINSGVDHDVLHEGRYY